MMKKPIVAFTSLAAGAAAAAMVVYMQRNPLAFTSVDQFEPRQVTSPSQPVYLDEEVEEEAAPTQQAFEPKATAPKAVVVMPVRRLVRNPPPELASEPAVVPAALQVREPCKTSSWVSVGVKFDFSGEPRYVREICP